MKLALALSCLAAAEAHNWMSSPSRANNGFNAFMQAPCPSKGSRVHVQVKAGQLFPFEYSTGHNTAERGGVYVTVLKAEDSKHMLKHTRALLDDYLENIPDGTPEYMAEHKAYHVGIGGGASLSGFPDAGKDFKAELKAHVEMGIPAANNIRTYGTHWTPKPGSGGKIYKKNPLFTAKDIRTKYHNPKYPWIISAHRFRLHEDKTDDADLVMMEIPEGSENGQYVIQYSWNGYYDCTDVNVISDMSTDLYGKPGAGIKYDRVDHCLWNPDVTPPKGTVSTYKARVAGKCEVFKAGTDGVNACKTACNNAPDGECTGVQVVPYQLEPGIMKNGLFSNAGSWQTYPAGCGNLKGEKDDLVCFTVKKGKTVVGGPMLIAARDPLDSVFYGTCLIKESAWEFNQQSAASGDAPPENTFIFGRECITCQSMEANKKKNRVPFWNLTDSCEHCESQYTR